MACLCGEHSTVSVQSRTWPGINKPGGVGRIVARHEDGTYDVKYILGGREKNIELKYISCGEEVPDENAENGRYRKARKSSVLLDDGEEDDDVDLVEEETSHEHNDRVDPSIRAVHRGRSTNRIHGEYPRARKIAKRDFLDPCADTSYSTTRSRKVSKDKQATNTDRFPLKNLGNDVKMDHDPKREAAESSERCMDITGQKEAQELCPGKESIKETKSEVADESEVDPDRVSLFLQYMSAAFKCSDSDGTMSLQYLRFLVNRHIKDKGRSDNDGHNDEHEDAERCMKQGQYDEEEVRRILEYLDKENKVFYQKETRMVYII